MADLERWRHYLTVFARTQVDPTIGCRLDLSGIVQQTLLEAHQSRQAFAADDTAAMVAWLRRALTNNLVDELRKLATAKRDVGHERSLDAALDASSLQLASWLAADQTSPSEGATRNEEAKRFADALERLPEAQKEALMLHHWHGWPLTRIAEHLGRSREAVAGLLKRAVSRLRKDLQSPE